MEARGGEGEIEILEARNLSSGGIFVAVPATECLWLLPDARVELSIGGVNDSAQIGDEALLEVRARVVWRVSSGGDPGVGLVFEDLDDAQRERLHAALRAAPERDPAVAAEAEPRPHEHDGPLGIDR
ncbi:MAG: PilZ domain-containing protein [Myxococcales bacterium]|nr:PilZ domain-containing protein [Myxococcales bacterium]